LDKPVLPGRPAQPDEDRLVLLGITTKPQGIKGGVRLMPQFDDLDDFEDLKTDRLFLKPVPATAGLRPKSAEYREVTIAEYDDHHRFLVLFFDGVSDMNGAEAYRNMEVYVYEDELWDLPEGKYYSFQLVGLELYDSATDTVVGTVNELRSGVQDHLVVQNEKGEFLVPYVPQVVTKVDLEQKRITADLPPGLDEM
jgi:16S rRNA processing protein RimM